MDGKKIENVFKLLYKGSLFKFKCVSRHTCANTENGILDYRKIIFRVNCKRKQFSQTRLEISVNEYQKHTTKCSDLTSYSK